MKVKVKVKVVSPQRSGRFFFTRIETGTSNLGGDV